MAGGRGSRLRPVVNDRPKPMAEVSGKPFLEWLLLALRAQGMRRVIFSTGYMSEAIESYFGQGKKWNMELEYSRELVPLGTAGAVRYALDKVSSNEFVVMNGDSYCPVEIDRLYNAHIAHKASATIWLTWIDDCRDYGTVVVGDGGEVQIFQEKSPKKIAGLVNAGVYILERDAIETIPHGMNISMETEFFPRLIGRGLYAVVGDKPFLDIGTPETFAKALEFLDRYSLKLKGAPDD